MTDQEMKELAQANLIAIRELRESQDRTDEQMKKTDEQMKKTDEQMKKTDEQMKKTDEQMKKTDEKMKKTDEKIDRMCQKIDKLGIYYGGISNNIGEQAEDFFYRYFQKNPRIRDIKFDEVAKTVITSDNAEHDIVLINGENIAVISVKFKLQIKDIDYLINKEIVRIRNYYQKFTDRHKMYGGVASYIITEEAEEYAKQKGLFVFTQSGDNTIMLNDEGFKAKIFV